MNSRQFIILGFHNKVGAHPMGVGCVYKYYVHGNPRKPVLSENVADAEQWDMDNACIIARRLNEHADGWVWWVWRAP